VKWLLAFFIVLNMALAPPKALNNRSEARSLSVTFRILYAEDILHKVYAQNLRNIDEFIVILDMLQTIRETMRACEERPREALTDREKDALGMVRLKLRARLDMVQARGWELCKRSEVRDKTDEALAEVVRLLREVYESPSYWGRQGDLLTASQLLEQIEDMPIVNEIQRGKFGFLKAYVNLMQEQIKSEVRSHA